MKSFDFFQCFDGEFVTFFFPVKLEELNSGDGDAVKLVSDNKDLPDEPIDVERRQKVKEAMIHAWSSYEKYAWGHDELQVMINSVSFVEQCRVSLVVLILCFVW